MNRKLNIFAILLPLYAPAFAALPPAYLSVPGFKQCLSEKKVDSYQIRCLPAKKPSVCAKISWQRLVAMEKKGELLGCKAK